MIVDVLLWCWALLGIVFLVLLLAWGLAYLIMGEDDE